MSATRASLRIFFGRGIAATIKKIGRGCLRLRRKLWALHAVRIQGSLLATAVSVPKQSIVNLAPSGIVADCEAELAETTGAARIKHIGEHLLHPFCHSHVLAR